MAPLAAWVPWAATALFLAAVTAYWAWPPSPPSPPTGRGRGSPTASGTAADPEGANPVTIDDIYDVALSRRPITIPRPPWSVIDPADHVVSARTWNELGRLPEALAYTATVAGNIMQAQADKTLDPLGAYARLTSITADLVAMLAVALDLPIEGVQ